MGGATKTKTSRVRCQVACRMAVTALRHGGELKRADEYCTFFASRPQVALSRIKQQMHREVGHSNMLQIGSAIVRIIRDSMEFLELPGGGTHQPFSATRHSGRTQVDEAEDDPISISFRDPGHRVGHRAGPGGLD